MTAEEMRRLPAGRELDALIAERVFQFSVLWRTGVPYASRTMTPLRSYSSSVGDAWRVIEHLRSLGWEYDLYSVGGERLHGCEFERAPRAKADAVADSAPLAICLAALDAVAA